MRKRVCKALSLALLLGSAAIGLMTCQAAPPGYQLQAVLIRDDRIEHRRMELVTRDWFYCYPPTGEIIRVPAGYVTDYASVPRGLWWLINPFGDQAEASVVHDWLYAVGEPGKFDYANDVFRYALREQGVPGWKTSLMYTAVSTLGRSAYGRGTEWECRFRSVRTEEPVAPWFPKPGTAVVTTSPSHCKEADWQQQIVKLQRDYASPLQPPNQPLPPASCSALN